MLPTNRAATRIQASFRGHLVRRELVDNVRMDFEEVMRRVEAPLRDANNANYPSSGTASSSPFPKGELGWKSSSSLSPPSVLDRLDDELDDQEEEEEDEDDNHHHDGDENAPVVATPPYVKGAASAVAEAIDAVRDAVENQCTVTDRRGGVGGGGGGGEGRGGGGRGINSQNVGDEDVEIRVAAGAGAGGGAATTGENGAGCGGGETAEKDERGGASAAAAAAAVGIGAGVADDVEDEHQRHHLSMLQQEMAWAQAALDNRRQHLRRMRLQQHQLQLQRGGVGIR